MADLEKTDQAIGMEEEVFEGKGMATIFGAPLSWVALFAAICAVTSLIPFYFYTGGGGYVPISYLFYPLAGMILGPWAGFVAGLVAGIIGMFIAPAAYPLGLVDALIAATALALPSGLIGRKYRWYFLVASIISIIAVYIFPYRWPGQAAGLAAPPEPAYTTCFWFVFVAIVIWLGGSFFTSLLNKWSNVGSSATTQTVGFILLSVVRRFAVFPIWMLPYAYILRWPPELQIFDNYASFPSYALEIVASGLLSMVVFRALWQAKLRRVPGSLLAELGEPSK